jgi:hypothetical protein
MRRYAFVTLAALLAIPGIQTHAEGGAAPPLFKNLSPADQGKLDAGEILVRSLSSPSKMSLAASGAAADALRSRISAIRPNYLTEVISAFPCADSRVAAALLERLAANLADVKSYIGIPYWSKQQKKTYDLFDKMVVNGKAATGGGAAIEVTEHMEPFDDFGARYEYRLLDINGAAAPAGAAASLAFTGSNTGAIIYSYRNFKAVKPGGMLWELYAFSSGKSLYIYGIGAVSAFDMLGLFRDRLEASFMGRVEAFFSEMDRRMRG